MDNDDQNFQLSRQEQMERVEHQNALLSIRSIMATKPGKDFFKYLFKHLDVCEAMPDWSMPDNFVRDRLGFLRAGQSIFKLASEANPEVTAKLLAEVEKEKHEELYRAYEQTNG